MNNELAIEIKNLSKMYNLSQIGTGTISQDLNRFFAKMRGKPDPYATLAELNDRTVKSKSNNIWALKDIDLTVERGEVLGIIGRNGAGKSTLLKILSSITAPTTGSIKYNGRMASLLEVGTGMHPEMTARENVFLNGAIMGMTRKEISKKLDDIVDFAGVVKYIDTPIKRFSSGMKVRLGFAVAAFLEPEILVVDEVLAVGDAEFQKRAVGKMQEVSKGGERTVLFVSHNMAAVQNLCNKGVYLKNGIVEYKGNIMDTLSAYQNDFFEIHTIDVKSRSDRQGNGLFKFTEVKFFNNKLEIKDSFFSDEEVIIGLKYETKDNTILNNVSVSIAINSNLDVQLTNLTNESSGGIFNQVSPGGTIYCKIKKIHLVSGVYNLNLFCKVNQEISDWIVNTCSLNIEKCDFYKSGFNQDKEQSIFLLDYQFEMV